MRDQVATMEEGRAPSARRRRGSPSQGAVPATVVYYLCRNGRHLEHPHLMELPLASPNRALYLRDVIHRLDALRGKGMAAMYSWSCKRRYKTGFVWHDVLEDDMLLPAQGSEYVLKGSLLLPRQSPPPADHDQQTIIPKVPCIKATPNEEFPARTRGTQEGRTTNSSSSSPPTVEVEAPQQGRQPQPQPQPALLPKSPSSSCATEEAASVCSSSSRSSSSSSPDKPTIMRGSAGSAPSYSGGESPPSPPPHSSIIAEQDVPTPSHGTSTVKDHHKKDTSFSTSTTRAMAAMPTDKKQRVHAGSSSSRTATGGRSGTLETLIRAEALGRRGATTKRIQEEEECSSLADDKETAQPANLLMRLMACGSTMSARQQHPACGLIRTTNKPRYQKKQHFPVEPPPPSPVLAPLGSLIMRLPVTTAGARVVSDSGDCGHCRGNMLVQTGAGKGGKPAKDMPTMIMLSSSYQDSLSGKETSKVASDNLEIMSKVLPQAIGMAPCQQPTSGTLVTINTDVSRNTGEQEFSNEPSSEILSRSTGKRINNPPSECARVASFHDEKDKATKIEERLASGARVIIQCTPLLKETYVNAKGM